MMILGKGIAIGFLMAAIIGPIGLLCIRRSLSHGFIVGLITGVGAACADALYAAIAAFVVSSASHFLLYQKRLLSIVGATYLVYLGVKIFMTEPVPFEGERVKVLGLLHSLVSTFLLTMTNPVTIFAFISIFISFGILTSKISYVAAWMLTLGVLIGSMLWWVLLSAGSSYLRSRLTLNIMQWINRASGIALILFAMYAILN